MKSLRSCLALAGAGFEKSRLATAIVERSTTYLKANWPPQLAESMAVQDAIDHLEGQLMDIRVQAAGTFDEKKHPRNPKGSEHGGQFTKKPEAVTNNPLLLSTMTKVGGSLGGSTPASQWEENSTGIKWYIKECQSDSHATNELLASRLYNLAGVRGPEMQKIGNATKLNYIGSKIAKTVGPASGYDPGVTHGFAADAWLANWDVVGASNDNLLLDADGHALRIDVGGSLFYRAQGGEKGTALGIDTVSEINIMRDPAGKNKSAAKVFSEMTPDDVRKSIMATVAKVTDDQIYQAVYQVAPSGIAGVQPPKIIDILKKRRDALIALAKAKAPAAPPKPAVPAEATVVGGKLFDLDSPVFKGDANKSDQIWQPPFEPKPVLPTGSQHQCMVEASTNTSDQWTLDNWNHELHPRPDRDGVPTNPKSQEWKVVEINAKAALNAWKSSATDPLANRLKRSAIRVFNARGIVWSGAGDPPETDDERWRSDQAIRMIYRDTQGRMAAADVTHKDRVVLYRGLKGAVTANGVLEGFSYQKSTAQEFNGHTIVKAWVPPHEILVDHKSAFIKAGGLVGEEKEWLVFAGGFGKRAAHFQDDMKAESKHSSSTPSNAIVDYSTPKPKKSVAIAGQIGAMKTQVAPNVTVTPPTPVAGYTISADAIAKAAVKESVAKLSAPNSKITEAMIINVKQMHAAGKKASEIKKATGISSAGLIHAIIHGLSKKYASTGPRAASMTKLLGVTQTQWQDVKAHIAEHQKQTGTFDAKKIAADLGLKEYQIKSIAYAQPKQK